MVDFTRKRLQVFVSSTFTDLKQERQAAVEAILSHEHIPAGMELFTSGDESQMEVIKQWIDDSDVYLLILGGRYGSIEPNTQKSYTHLEYEYALEKGKPYFACVVNEQAQKERIKQHGDIVIEMDNPQQLKSFRQLVESKIVKYWSDCKDIKIIVGETMANYARREELIGWVRGDQAVSQNVSEELARLIKENEQLKSQLANNESKEELINGLSFSELKALLEEKGLLEFLEKNSMNFSGRINHLTLGFVQTNDERINRLFLLGILELKQINDKTRITKLTNAGVAFINKLEAEKLKLKKESSPLIDNENLGQHFI